MIAPFTLRRTKDSVLNKLPEKIEDLRIYRLSEEQVKLYCEAISVRGKELAQTLKNEKEKIPYIHIFALLNLLKQICNHPALVLDCHEKYKDFASGKWELFQEIFRESLDSGQKVFVFSQLLGIIRMIELYMADENIDYVTLTGSSRRRGEIIGRFNQDPDCRVYVGSLRAGALVLT